MAGGRRLLDDGVIWHSNDGLEMTAADNAELVRSLYADVISEQHYDDVRRYQIDGGVPCSSTRCG